MEFATRSIHIGQRPDPSTGATIPPIFLSTTFTQTAQGEHQGYEYSRSGKPNPERLGGMLASLEEGEACAAFSSGLAASAAVFQTLQLFREMASWADTIFMGAPAVCWNRCFGRGDGGGLCRRCFTHRLTPEP